MLEDVSEEMSTKKASYEGMKDETKVVVSMRGTRIDRWGIPIWKFFEEKKKILTAFAPVFRGTKDISTKQRSKDGQ